MLLISLLVTAAMAAAAIIGGTPPPPQVIGYAAAGLNALGGAGAVMVSWRRAAHRGFAIQRSKGSKAQ